MSFLEARHIRKRFGHVEALRGADFDVTLGNIVALVGDNGAGKSTLVKILAGVLHPDGGKISVEGHEVAFANPHEARNHGIETVYQDLALAGELSPAANLFLGREMRVRGLFGRLGFLDDRRMDREAAETFAQFGINVTGRHRQVSFLSGGQRQSVAVARAAVWASKVVFLDEPTAALGVVQSRAVKDLIRRVRDRGVGVVLISHNMPEVLELADKIQVMRFGVRVAALDARDATIEGLVTAMTAGDASESGAAS